MESAISSGGMLKPVKEKEKPRLALEARLRAAPLLTSSNSNFICALLDFLMCVFLLPPEVVRPGEAAVVSLLLDLPESVPPLPPSETPSLFMGDLNAASTVSANCSDLVLAKDVFALSMLQSSQRY
jgi:hypothetical protein